MVPWRRGRLGVVLVAVSTCAIASGVARAQVISVPPNKPLPTVATTTTEPPPTTAAATTSTNALLEALRPLQGYGLTRDQAIAIGFGRFPVGGEAYFRDDFGEPRVSPEAHSHQGNDIFAAFGTPVRSPANGVVNFTNE